MVTKTEKLIEKHNTIIEKSTDYDIYGAPYTTTSSRKKKIREDKVRGILLRITGPKVDGVAAVKEIEYPNGFSDDVEWIKNP